MEIRAKNIVITGGTGGIALALGRHLLKHGAEKLALLDIVECKETITKLRDDYPNKEIVFHLTDVVSKSNLEEAFKEVISKFTSIDCVIACAGVFDESNYERTVNINLLGLIHTNYIGLRYMGKDKGGNGGVIVNIASVAGIDCSQFSTPTYNATKHAVVAFSRSLGDDFYYKETGVKCITVCPGVTYTKFLDNAHERTYSDEAFATCKKKLGKVLTQTVDEFAAAFIDALHQDKNGAVWLIDGGRYKEIEYANHWLDNADNATK